MGGLEMVLLINTTMIIVNTTVLLVSSNTLIREVKESATRH